MNTAIIYTTKHGTTEKIAAKIKSGLENDNTKLFNLKKNKKIDLQKFETVIIGGSIHAGSIQRKLKNFIKNNLSILIKQRIALFLVCMEQGEKCKIQFNNAFPAELRKISIADGFLGGEYIFDKMNFMERAIIKKMTGETSSVSKIDESSIEKFVKKINLMK